MWGTSDRSRQGATNEAQRRHAGEAPGGGVAMNADARRAHSKALLAEIETLQTQFDIFRLLKRICDLFSFRAFIVMYLPDQSGASLGAQSVITNWPAEMIAGYDRLELLKTSPVISSIRNSTRPLVISLAERTRAAPEDKRQSSDALFRKFGFLMGVAVPVHDTAGRRGIIMFHGDRPAPCHGELLELSMLCIHVYEQMARIAHVDAKDVSPLTERETDCLSWTAEGKTSGEIAAILGLSEHTVNHYLNRAAKKLSTVNRTQAVAKALRRGWIK